MNPTEVSSTTTPDRRYVDCGTCGTTGQVTGEDEDGNETLVQCPTCSGAGGYEVEDDDE